MKPKLYRLALHGPGTIRIIAPTREQALQDFRARYPNLLIKAGNIRLVRADTPPENRTYLNPKTL